LLPHTKTANIRAQRGQRGNPAQIRIRGRETCDSIGIHSAHWPLACCCRSPGHRPSRATAQWTTASGGNGHYYQVVGLAAPISWSDANTAATAAGGYLATITSANENTFVFNLTNSPAYWDQSVNDHGPWLGGFQPSGSQEPAGGWQWVTQPGAGSPEPFSYTNWAAGQPSNDNGIEDSLNFFHSGTGTADTWNDEANSNTFVKSYVIEYNSAPTPEPGTALAGVLVGVGLLMRRRRVAR